MRRILRDVPRWHVYLHREARGLPTVGWNDNPQRIFEDELFDRLFSGESEGNPDVDDTDSPLAGWAKKLHQTCGHLPAFERLAQECLGDADAAATAVETLMAELAPQMQHPPDAVEAPLLRKTVLVACDKSSAAIDEQREATEALADVQFVTAGKSHVKSGESRENIGTRRLATRMKNDDRLRRIALLAGRFKRIAARKQKAKVKHGADEVTDVEMGSELSRLLPVEMAGLMHPVRRLALLRDLVEGRALQYRLEGAESLGKGPLVVALDKSGSMSGPSDIWATAVALALLEVAQMQRRHFALLCFDAGIKHEELVAPAERLPEQALFVQCAGGTSIDRVLFRSLQIIAEHPGALKMADVVLVTDGGSEDTNAPAVRQRAAELGVTVLGFGIGVDEESLKPWCDEVHAITSLNSSMDDKTAQKLFGTV